MSSEEPSGLLARPAVRRVQAALEEAGNGARRCDSGKFPQLAGLNGKVSRADADAVRAATGYTIGGVPPVAHPSPLPTVIDASFGRFDTILAAAGHPHCVFDTMLDELARLSGGAINHEVREEM